MKKILLPIKNFFLVFIIIFFITTAFKNFFSYAQDNCSRSIGDANCDGVVDDSDYIIWRCFFLGRSNCINNQSQTASDFNFDNKINLIDFEIWRFNRFSNNTNITPSITPMP